MSRLFQTIALEDASLKPQPVAPLALIHVPYVRHITVLTLYTQCYFKTTRGVIKEKIRSGSTEMSVPVGVTIPR